MPVRKLTADFVKTATAEPGAERTVYWDIAMPSFGLLVLPSGHKSWICQYRTKRISRRLTIKGVLSLNDARKEAKAILGQVARGGDPVADRRRESETGRNALASVVDAFFKRDGSKLRSAKPMRSTLERLVLPKLGRLPIDQIRRSDITQMLDDAEDRNGPVMADRALAALRRIFSWHATRADNFVSPIVRGMTRTDPDDRERDRLLDDAEIRKIWATAEKWGAPWGPFVHFLLLSAARRNEVAEMTWDELEGDTWKLPPARHKINKGLKLPLSETARQVLASLPRIDDCRFVFTADGRKPLSGFSMFKTKLDSECGVSDWRIHDLRRTARSLLSRAGVSADIGERCLGHTIRGIRGTYDRHDFEPEMRDAFERLAKLIKEIVEIRE